MGISGFIKKKIKRLAYGYRCDSQSYIAHLRSIGMRIGEGTRIFSPQTVSIDERTPCMIEIGKHVEITAGVTILTHGFDWCVLKGVYGDILGSRSKVTIGDNCFIGIHSTILKGVTIGNNVIIGANSVVTKDIPDNSVAVGNPARVVMSLEEYYEKRKNAQIAEATELVKEYRKVYGKNPSEKDMSEFFWLFTDKYEGIDDSWKNQMAQAGNLQKSIEKLEQNPKSFENMQAFFDSIE